MRHIFYIFILISVPVFSQSPEVNYAERLEVQVPGVDQAIILIAVEGGDFIMGNNDVPDESPEHKVSVNGLYVGQTEITWNQYDAFVFRNTELEQFISEEEQRKLGIDGISSATTPYVDMSFNMGKDDFPAVNMTQYAALMYCQWLTAQTGRFFRLPTEAEWEYICKKSEVENQKLVDYAFYNDVAYELTAEQKADKLGLYDILGNVAEWTMDQYDESFYANSPQDNPWNKPETLYPRVVRGGHYLQKERELSCSARIPSEDKWKKRDPQLPKSKWWHTNAPFVGFRIVSPFHQPTKEEIEKYWLEAMEDYGE